MLVFPCRDYNDHKTVKEQSGSTTSLNSLSGYDTNTKDSLVSSGREKEEGSAYRRTRSDLSAEIISRANAEASTEDRKSSWYSKWVPMFLAACRRALL
ncbi:hypothetical protein E2C01_008194 [Portunus trituberculatus]|uniref:Uncharacterized protein n=1 Tax=Portunus trituberculatus TaxID=210409 RepID=A0A5B7D3A4_PORTR|nr:hypothetical protein [Portunus trituberculatus]